MSSVAATGVPAVALVALGAALWPLARRAFRLVRSSAYMIQINVAAVGIGLAVAGPAMAIVSRGTPGLLLAPGLVILGAEFGLFAGVLESSRYAAIRSALHPDRSPLAPLPAHASRWSRFKRRLF